MLHKVATTVLAVTTLAVLWWALAVASYAAFGWGIVMLALTVFVAAKGRLDA